MAAFFLEHLGRNVVRLDRGQGLTVTNTSDGPADVFVDCKQGGTWSFNRRMTLAAGESWSITRGELGHDQVRLMALGKDDGRHIVRVEH